MGASSHVPLYFYEDAERSTCTVHESNGAWWNTNIIQLKLLCIPNNQIQEKLRVETHDTQLSDHLGVKKLVSRIHSSTTDLVGQL